MYYYYYLVVGYTRVPGKLAVLRARCASSVAPVSDMCAALPVGRSVGRSVVSALRRGGRSVVVVALYMYIYYIA